MGDRTWVNGQSSRVVSINNRALNYGDGVFETMRRIDGRFPLMKYHLARLEKASNALGLNFKHQEFCDHLCSLNLSDGGVKVLLSRKSGGRGYVGLSQSFDLIVQEFRLVDMPPSLKLDISSHKLPRREKHLGLKLCSAYDYVRAARDIKNSDDVLVLDEHDYIIETTRANVIFSIRGQSVTPDLSKSGVRGTCLNALISSGIAIETRNIHLTELSNIEAAITVNALVGAMSVSSIAEQPMSNGSEFEQIYHWLKKNGY